MLEGYLALINLRLMQSLSAAQNAGNTLVVGVPGGFVPLKNGNTAPNAESGEGSYQCGRRRKFPLAISKLT